MACSAAPEQIIRRKNRDRRRSRNKAPGPEGDESVSPETLSSRVRRGTRAKKAAFSSGSRDQSRGSHIQEPAENSWKNKVESSTTPICPQQ